MWSSLQFYLCSILAIAFLSAVVALALVPLTDWNSKQWKKGNKYLVLFSNCFIIGIVYWVIRYLLNF